MDSLLKIKNAFVLEPPFSSLLGPSTSARLDETAPPSMGVYSLEDPGPVSKMGFADLLAGGETGLQLTSSNVIEHERCLDNPDAGQVFSAAIEPTRDFAANRTEENDKLLESVDEKERVDLGAGDASLVEKNNESNEMAANSRTKSEAEYLDEASCLQRTLMSDWSQVGNAANLMRPFEMRSMYTPTSPYAAPPYFSSLTPPAGGAQSSTGASNLPARVRNPSSGYGGLVLLRHPGYQQQEESKRASGGSERELPLTQLSAATVYDNALGKDKTQRWSFAGTAPEVELLRLKLEKVERELKELRGKHEATMNDYQRVLHQLESSRASKCRQDVDLANVASELNRLKADYDVSCQQRVALERQVRRTCFNFAIGE